MLQNRPTLLNNLKGVLLITEYAYLPLAQTGFSIDAIWGYGRR